MNRTMTALATLLVVGSTALAPIAFADSSTNGSSPNNAAIAPQTSPSMPNATTGGTSNAGSAATNPNASAAPSTGGNSATDQSNNAATKDMGNSPSAATNQPSSKQSSMNDEGSKHIRHHRMAMLSQHRVEEIQTALANKSGDKLAIDGIWGPQTRNALRDFQKQQGLPATGRLSQATLKKLNPPTWNG